MRDKGKGYEYSSGQRNCHGTSKVPWLNFFGILPLYEYS
ncbi:hypothetical protein JOD02_002210 [Caldicoprobacter guelmensis]|nr:hypothetical protein [Caldicoprobacter guelmensis]